MHRISQKFKGSLNAALAADEVSLFQHFRIVFRFFINSGPHRHHEFNAHIVQLCDHAIRVWPVGRIKAPIALLEPVEIIHYNHINGQAAPLILPCDLQKLVLRLVTELALPEAKPVFRHHRHGPGHSCVALHDLLRAVSSNDPIVENIRRIGFKARQVLSEYRAANRRIVPQQAISEAGK